MAFSVCNKNKMVLFIFLLNSNCSVALSLRPREKKIRTIVIFVILSDHEETYTNTYAKLTTKICFKSWWCDKFYKFVCEAAFR